MNKEEVHQDQIYIEGLLNNDSRIIHAIYDKFSFKVIHYIKMNSGNEEEAKDVIQEVLIMIYNQAKQNGLKLTCPFDAYFFLLCKRRWLNELKKSSKKEVTLPAENVSKDETLEEMLFQTDQFNERQVLFEMMFQKLGEKCQEILKLSFVTKTMEEVAKKLNVSYAYARKKKSLCTGKLTELIQESVIYQSLKNF
ncbi:RNA polymerase sigma factor [Flavobacterium sp.]|uniref:RNA polymerase sigma factor n=1 Tax=Flavobacterium sp. TaxID=239 RepID=UPI004048415B